MERLKPGEDTAAAVRRLDTMLELAQISRDGRRWRSSKRWPRPSRWPWATPRWWSSIGVARSEPGAERARELLGRADQAMYAAKAAGRNRSRSWGE